YRTHRLLASIITLSLLVDLPIFFQHVFVSDRLITSGRRFVYLLEPTRSRIVWDNLKFARNPMAIWVLQRDMFSGNGFTKKSLGLFFKILSIVGGIEFFKPTSCTLTVHFRMAL